VAGSSDFPRFNPEFKRSAQSFAQLRDPAFLQRRPREVRLIEANGRQTLQEIFSSAGVVKDLWNSVAILNGMDLATKPPQGQLIKVVR